MHYFIISLRFPVSSLYHYRPFCIKQRISLPAVHQLIVVKLLRVEEPRRALPFINRDFTQTFACAQLVSNIFRNKTTAPTLIGLNQSYVLLLLLEELIVINIVVLKSVTELTEIVIILFMQLISELNVVLADLLLMHGLSFSYTGVDEGGVVIGVFLCKRIVSFRSLRLFYQL